MLHTKALVVRESVGATQAGVIDSVIGSTAVLDRMGDIIDQAGWDLKAYTDNPVILWGHNMDEERPPIAKALKVWIQDKGTKNAALMFRIQFDLADSFAADIYRKIKEGFINTVSVGFLPTEWEELEPGNFWGGLKYTAQQLLELSFVCVPANPQALVGLRSFAKEDKRFTPIDETKLFRPIVDKKSLKDIFKLSDEELKQIKGEQDKAETINVDQTQTMDEEGNISTGGNSVDEGEKPNGSEEMPPYDHTAKLGDITVKDLRNEMDACMQKCMDTQNKSVTDKDKKDYVPDDEVKPDTNNPKEPGQGMGDLAEMPADNMQVKDMTVGHTRTLFTDVFADWTSNMNSNTNNDQNDNTNDNINNYSFEVGDTKEAVVGKMKTLKGIIEKAGRVLSSKNETRVRQAMELLDAVINELDKEEIQEEASQDTPKEQEDIETKEMKKGVIAYADHGKAPESEAWDGPGERAKATTADLKIMCAWYDDSKPDDKSSYKLPHHKADGDHVAVWRGVAAAMASLMGSRGGTDIPEGDRKGVYNHLKKHYDEFGKDAPDFKMVEDQVFRGLTEELLALTLDREEKHIARLVKKVLENQKQERQEKIEVLPLAKEKGITEKHIAKALEVLDLALTKIVVVGKEVK